MLSDREASEVSDQGLERGLTADIDRGIRAIIAESTETTDFEDQDRWRSTIDAEIGSRIRAILSDALFRRLEASWFSLYQLMRTTESDGCVRIRLLDFSQEAQRREALAKTKLEESTLYRLFGQEEATRPGERAVDLIVTDYAFDTRGESQLQLMRLAELADRGGLPILAAAKGSAIEIESASASQLGAWAQLQTIPGGRLTRTLYTATPTSPALWGGKQSFGGHRL